MTKRARLALDGEPSSVGRARTWVGDTLRAWACEPLRDAARLVTSELVGNGVRHAGTPLTVDLSLGAHELRIAVTDAAPSDVAPRPHHAGPWADGGRGLALVEAVSDRWGIEPTAVGKTVWAAWDR